MQVVLEKISPDECAVVSHHVAEDFSFPNDFKSAFIDENHEWFVQVDNGNCIVSIMMKYRGVIEFEAGLFLKSSSSVMFICGAQFFRAYLMP